MRYTPFETMERMLDELRRDMWEFREDWDDWSPRAGSYGPSFDLTEHDGEFVLTVDLPGFEREEIDLRFDDGELVLSATHGVTDESSARSRSIHERIGLPKEIVEDGIAASYHNGVLEVHLPVVEGATERGRRIDID